MTLWFHPSVSNAKWKTLKQPQLRSHSSISFITYLMHQLAQLISHLRIRLGRNSNRDKKKKGWTRLDQLMHRRILDYNCIWSHQCNKLSNIDIIHLPSDCIGSAARISTSLAVIHYTMRRVALEKRGALKKYNEYPNTSYTMH